MSHPRRAFTLIELLVVIGIISLLLAILAPTLAAARARSKGTVCATNLRSLAHGWHMYAEDFDDIIVPGRLASLPGGMGNPANFYDVGNGMKFRARWLEMIGKYVGLYAFDNPDGSNDRQDYDAKVYQCATVPDWIDARNHGWGYNYQFLGNSRKSNGAFINFPVNRSKIPSMDGTVMAADSMGTAASVAVADRLPYNNNGEVFAELGNHSWSLDPPRLTDQSDAGTGDAGSPRTAVDPRHQGRVNAIFCDGHVESATPEALGYIREPDGRYAFGGPAGPGQPYNTRFSGRMMDLDPPAKP